MLTQEDIDWVFLDTVDSTNTYLVRAYAAGQHRGVTAVLAKTQTQGRGRAGRAWVSEPGQGLCLSMGLPLDSKTIPCLPICVGVGLAEGLQSLGVSVSLKWPNDVLVQGAKLAGVLCEGGVADTGPFTVVGIGVNIRPLLLPINPTGLPFTSLAQHWVVGKPLLSPKELAERLVPCVVSAIESGVRFGLSTLIACFERRDAFFGRAVRVLDKGQEHLRGLALGLAPDGAYRIQTPDGERRVYVGDLSLRGIHDD